MHHVAAAALVRDGTVLLGHRHPARRYYPDCWDLVGGHVEPGESPVDAVRRECLEELAVVVDDPRPVQLTFSDPAVEMHAFVVTSWSGEPRNAAPDEHDELRFFAREELLGLVLADPAALPDLLAVLDAKG
ncbi:hypothetical protein GCM10009633_14280 [Janibacter melonis]|uniref:NUDIX domain-containing protein n=1 Tax=Janibacter melonis TaxID=262209 RepID=UPI001E3BFD0A|nr:NUDIX domain-containing protein [Janibacter melonis]MCB5991424.1 NUDIX domain-containing protein [Janibacter melonis]